MISDFSADIRELSQAFGVTEEYANELASKLVVPEQATRFDTKCELKRQLYNELVSAKGFTLPWGTLTGIRPTKLAMQGIDFKKVFYCSDEKTELCFEIAEREKEILKRTDEENGWSLYIGIPFCPSRCLYCSFTSYPITLWEDKKKDYIKALCKEIEEVSKIMKDKKLETIYMGGGTPTSIDADDLRTIIDKVYECNDTSHLLEFTVEAGRPDSITKDKLIALKECDITRISVNPQTMNQKTLDLIGRKHTTNEVIEKFNLARDLGFDNINMDIIVGLPNETVEDVVHTMDELEKLRPDDITVHSLALKRAARLNEEKEKFSKATFEEMCKMLDVTNARCRGLGLKPYYMYRQKNMAGNFENVGYAHEGKEGIYNILIMEEKQRIVGCGAGCTTKLPLKDNKGVTRIENVKDPQIYIERIDEMIERKRELQ